MTLFLVAFLKLIAALAFVLSTSPTALRVEPAQVINGYSLPQRIEFIQPHASPYNRDGFDCPSFADEPCYVIVETGEVGP